MRIMVVVINGCTEKQMYYTMYIKPFYALCLKCFLYALQVIERTCSSADSILYTMYISRDFSSRTGVNSILYNFLVQKNSQQHEVATSACRSTRTQESLCDIYHGLTDRKLLQTLSTWGRVRAYIVITMLIEVIGSIYSMHSMHMLYSKPD